MITLQHSLITLFANNGNEKEFDKEISYVLLPDAIRKYCSSRQYSHFEINPKNGDISWIQYPVNLKELSKEKVDELHKHLSDDIIPCVLGEETMIPSFENHNRHLPMDEYFGIKKHLVQDKIFDEWIREQINCTNKYDNKFVFQGKEYDGNGIRELIADIENQGLYILAYMNYETYGITTNQEWFDKHVKGQLDQRYSQDLSDGTYKYMTIPEDIDKMITEHDWSKLGEGIIPLNTYVSLYRQVANEMVKIDLEKQKINKKTMPEGPEDR